MDDGMIAFLPTDGSWCQQDFPHMTLIYTGSIADRPPTDFNAMAKDAITAARVTGAFSLRVTGVEEFGPEDSKVDVLTFYPSPELIMARKKVEHWDAGDFPEYKPHATIGPAGSAVQFFEDKTGDPYDRRDWRIGALPLSMFFSRLAVCWGEQKLIFDLYNL